MATNDFPAGHIHPVDAMALMIFYYEGGRAGSPQSRILRNNNPGNLRPLNAEQPQEDGYRVFPRLVDGWQALIDDIEYKLRHHFTPESTLLDLLDRYAPAGDHNNPTDYAIYGGRFLSLALNCEGKITVKTPLTAIFGEPAIGEAK